MASDARLPGVPAAVVPAGPGASHARRPDTGTDDRGTHPHRRTEVLLVVSLALATLVLGLTGLPYGLPEIYHPDTPKQLARVPDFMRGDLVPDDTYPTLHMYGVALLLKYVVALVRAPSFSELGPTLTEVAVGARLLNAFLAAGIGPLVYVAGRGLLGGPSAALAAALVAVSPILVLHAHYEMGDVLQAFLATACVAATARAMPTGRVSGFLLAGVCAGLAASAKYYGVLVLGAVAVGILASPMPARRKVWVGLAAGLAAVATFVLTTPKLLLTPAEFVEQIGRSSELYPVRLPQWWRRPVVAGRLLTGLALDWFGPLTSALALAGAVALLARARAALVLATPVLVLGLYVGWRSNYLDDRNLVILVPFVALMVAAALVWLARRGRWTRLAAIAVGLVVLGSAAVESLQVALLFWQGDTIRYAARWYERHVSASVTVANRLRVDSLTTHRESGANLLRVSSREYGRHLLWYGARLRPHVGRALDLLSEHGKLLKRFELQPRGFIAPTIAYYDLGAPAVPYAFPPPEALANPREALVFVDADTVPEPLGFVAEHRRPAVVALVSRTPLSELTLGLSGQGRIGLHQGWRTLRARVEPGRLTIVRLTPRRGFPWFKYVYRLTVDARDGPVYVRILPTPCDVARARLLYGEWDQAAPALAACRTRWGEPTRLLDLASTQARLGRPEEARATLAALQRTAPGVVEALADLVRQPDGEAWRERYRTLAGHGRWFWHPHIARIQAEDAGQRIGVVLGGSDAVAGRVLLARPDLAKPGYMKIWFPQHFLRGRYLVRFRLRGHGPGPTPLATLSVVRHFQHAVLDVPTTVTWPGAPTSAAFHEVVLPVVSELEPVGFEARVFYHGRGTLEIDEVSIVPDVRSTLAATIEPLRPLLSRH